MNRFIQSLIRHAIAPSSAPRPAFQPSFETLGGQAHASYRPHLERLEDRLMPALIASQVLPLLNPGVATTTVSVTPGTLVFSDTVDQRITLTATIGGGASGGSVNFTVTNSLGAVLGTVNNVPVSNGVAQTPFTVPAGTPPGTFTVSAIYSGSGSMGSSSFTITPDDCARSRQANNILGSAQTFAVLAGSTVTNVINLTPPQTNIFGDVGVSPGSAITGFPPGIVHPPGTIHAGDAAAAQAQNDLTPAYNTLAGMSATNVLTGLDLGGRTLTPGVYFFASSAQLTGTLTLNAAGNPDALFVFQIGTTLTTASSSSVVMINGGLHDNVFWQVGTSATLGTTTAFVGNIVAQTSITLNTGANIECGRALAMGAAVTLDTNVIEAPGFSPSPGPSQAPSSLPGNSVGVTPGLSPSISPPQGFIPTLYEAELGRAASAAEVSAWTTVLNTSGRAAVVDGIGLSPEARRHSVDIWYQQFLGRQAQGGEEMGWVNLLQQGRSEADVLGSILATGEFAQKSGPSDQQFVQSLYSNLLHRSASDADLQGWGNAVSAQGRQAVAQGILNSQEFRADAVFAFYNDLLGRPADSAGLNGWTSSNLDVAQIRLAILASSEFAAHSTP